jgi:hypothetical protein
MNLTDLIQRRRELQSDDDWNRLRHAAEERPRDENDIGPGHDPPDRPGLLKRMREHRRDREDGDDG